MILLFPNLPTLQLALTSGLLPEEVAAAPGEFATHEDGRIWVKFSAELKPDLSSLKTLGIVSRKSTRGSTSDLLPVTCWPQIVPLEKFSHVNAVQESLSERTPVLFELPESANFADVVTEMLRLGNDRQSFRQQQTAEGVRTLLLVKGPPYYTLLRAIDQLDGVATPKAYVEQHPRVWVEFGYRHPLAEQIQPADGTFLLLNQPREWTAIEEGKFRDIYETLRFTVPNKPVRWESAPPDQPLQVPLRLVRGGTDDPAELWVLSEPGISQLEDLVRRSDDRLISRLAFAVGTSAEKNNERTVVVKVRPGKEPPPVLVLDGIPCRSYLRIPHLFLPVGYRLHPPLRRDAVKHLLAEDANSDTWLIPEADGQFRPQCLPDNAFRPLAEWVQYVIDSSRDALSLWMETMQFDFDSFLCPEDSPAPKPPKINQQREPQPKQTQSDKPQSIANKPSRTKQSKTVKTTATKPARENTLTLLPPSELELRLQDLEKQFRESPEPSDSPARQQLWRELAPTNMALGHTTEGATCYVQGIWQQEELSADWIQEWYEAETQSLEQPPLSGETFEGILKEDRPTPTQLNLLAIHIIQAAFGERGIPENGPSNLGRIQQHLENFDTFLPVRTAWLAWLGCAKMAHDDLLTLARTRDRLLERLYQYGLSPELELPGFLRTTGPRTGERFRSIQESLLAFRERIRHWIEQEFPNKGQTAAYADLILAYGYSRVGLNSQCQELVNSTGKLLLKKPRTNPVHQWVLGAFQYRITQSLEGKNRAGRLDKQLMDVLVEKTLEPKMVFALKSLIAKSRILEPHEQVNSQREFVTSSQQDLGLQIERLSDIENPVELAGRMEALLETCPFDQLVEVPDSDTIRRERADVAVTAKGHQVVLAALLSFAPRLGETRSHRLLSEVLPTLELLSDANQKAVLLERAIFVAAHFGQVGHARKFVAQLHELYDEDSSPETAAIFGLLLGQTFRGLRILGMRGEISRVLEQLEQLIADGRFEAVAAKGKTTKKKRKTTRPINQILETRKRLDAMTLRLSLAAGWFYFGNEIRASSIMEEVERFLYQDLNLLANLRLAFACRYASTLEQAPIDSALPKLSELFTKLTKEHISRGMGAGLQDEFYLYEPLVLAEAVVLALVSDDMTVDPQARRLMEENEFAIRRRIHRDMESARHRAESEGINTTGS